MFISFLLTVLMHYWIASHSVELWKYFLSLLMFKKKQTGQLTIDGSSESCENCWSSKIWFYPHDMKSVVREEDSQMCRLFPTSLTHHTSITCCWGPFPPFLCAWRPKSVPAALAGLALLLTYAISSCWSSTSCSCPFTSASLLSECTALLSSNILLKSSC